MKQILQIYDKLSFYESITQLKIVNTFNDDTIYECEGVNIHSGKVFNFTLEPDFETEENQIHCSRNYAIINENGEKEELQRPFHPHSFLETNSLNFFKHYVNELIERKESKKETKLKKKKKEKQFSKVNWKKKKKEISSSLDFMV
eukprot:gene6346-10353_t